MGKTQSQTTNGSRGGSIGLLLAAVVSAAALWLAAGGDRQAMDLATPPFGFHRVIVVHALASLLLSWGIARELAGFVPDLTARPTVILWIAAGMAVAWATIAGADFVAHALESGRAGYGVRLAVRVLWCTVLQVPWCLMGRAAAPQPAAEQGPMFSRGNFFALALLVACAVPMSYLEILIEQQTAIARDFWREFRLAKARLVVRRLSDLGSTRSLGRTRPAGSAERPAEQVPPRLALVQLETSIEHARNQVSLFSSGEPTDPRRRQLARWLVTLGKDAEAAAAIEPLARRDAAAALQLAEILHAQKQWQAGRPWLERAIQTAQATQASSPAETETNEQIQSRAYTLLMLGAGKQMQYEAAERYGFAALGRLPARRADFHYRLGRHYEFLGRPFRAVEHLQKAAQLAPDEYDQPEDGWMKVLSSGAPLGLFRPAASRHL